MPQFLLVVLTQLRALQEEAALLSAGRDVRVDCWTKMGRKELLLFMFMFICDITVQIASCCHKENVNWTV